MEPCAGSGSSLLVLQAQGALREGMTGRVSLPAVRADGCGSQRDLSPSLRAYPIIIVNQLAAEVRRGCLRLP